MGGASLSFFFLNHNFAAVVYGSMQHHRELHAVKKPSRYDFTRPFHFWSDFAAFKLTAGAD